MRPAKSRYALSQSQYVELADDILGAETGEEFVKRLKSGVECVEAEVEDLKGDSLPPAFVSALRENRHDFLRRSVLDLCAWPLLEKTSLPGDYMPGKPFLWLFALPFVVTFSPEQPRDEIIQFPDGVLDVNALLLTAELSGHVSTATRLRAFDQLYLREDFYQTGIRQLTAISYAAELGQALDCPPTRGIALDADIESWRTVTYFLLCTALADERTLVGPLFNRSREWPAEVAAAEVAAGLRARGLKVESVRSFRPCQMSTTQLRMSAPALYELEQNLVSAKEAYGALDIVLRFPTNGFAEINGFVDIEKRSDEMILVPTFQVFEPRGVLAGAVKDAAIRTGHRFSWARADSMGLPAVHH